MFVRFGDFKSSLYFFVRYSGRLPSSSLHIVNFIFYIFSLGTVTDFKWLVANKPIAIIIIADSSKRQGRCVRFLKRKKKKNDMHPLLA